MLLSHTDGETVPDGARVEEVKMPVWQRQLGMRDDKKVWERSHARGFPRGPFPQNHSRVQGST